MTYTEIKEVNGKKYYYRVKSIRQGRKFKKIRKYIGKNLSKKEISLKEKKADVLLKKTQAPPTALKKIIPRIRKILLANQVQRAGIFGSYATGKQKKSSDVDILIELRNNNLSLLDFIDLKLKIEDRIKKKVDLVEYKAIKPRIKSDILKEEVKIL